MSTATGGGAPRSLTEGSITRPILSLSTTFALGYLLNMVTFVVDRKFVGEVGTTAMAALGSAHAALMVLVTFVLGMALGTLAGVARSMGARQPEEATRFTVNGIYIGFGFGALMFVASFFLPDRILAFMGADAAVAGPASEYLAITMAGMLAHAPLLMLAFAFQGAGLQRTALLLSAIPAVLNALLDWPFIFGLDLGVAGAAWAGVVAHVVGLVLAVILIRRSPLRPPPGGLRFAPDVSRRIIVVGVPGSLEHVVRTFAGFALVALITPFGQEVVSAYTSGQVVMMLLITPGMAIGQATATLVGQNLGAGRPRRAWDTVWVSTGLYVSLMVVAGSLIYAFAEALIGAFDSHPRVIEEGARLLHVAILCFPLLAVAMTVSRAFAGAGRTLPMMVVAAIAHLGFQVPLVYVLSARMGPTGAYVGMALAFCVHGVLAALLFLHRFGPWRRGEMVLN